MIPDMKFAYMSWEAFATLFTGVAAVGGAMMIGRNQQKIIEGQAEIERLTLDASLFERRLKIVDSFNKLRRSLKWRASDPDDALAEFAKESEVAVFLFPMATADLISEIWGVATKLVSARKGMDEEVNEGNKQAIYDVMYRPAEAQFDILTVKFFSELAPHMTLHTQPLQKEKAPGLHRGLLWRRKVKG